MKFKDLLNQFISIELSSLKCLRNGTGIFMNVVLSSIEGDIYVTKEINKYSDQLDEVKVKIESIKVFDPINHKSFKFSMDDDIPKSMIVMDENSRAKFTPNYSLYLNDAEGISYRIFPK